jgi:hypothetical protein
MPDQVSAGHEGRPAGPARGSQRVSSPGAQPIAGMLQPEECRAGRALLGWSLHELATRSGFPAPTIAEFEEGRRLLSLSARVALQRVFRKGLSKAAR